MALFAWTLSTAAGAEPVRVVRLSPATQTALPGQLVPTPFTLRVERAGGEPIAGVQLWYGVDVTCPAGLGECPDEAALGGFEPGYAGGPLFVLVTTGSDGTVTTPPYRAGTPPFVPFSILFTPTIFPQTTPDGIVIDGMLSGDGNSTVTVEGLTAIPTLGGAGLAALLGLLAAAGLWTMRLQRRRAAMPVATGRTAAR